MIARGDDGGTAVRLASDADREALAATLARAFEDDPVMTWLIARDDRRRRGLERFFAFVLRTEYVPGGLTFTTPDHAGAALWSPPGKKPPTWRDALRMAPLAPVFWRSGPAGLRLLGDLERARPWGTPHFYLGVLGTVPERQGSGIGSALMAPVLARCDNEGVGAYLESSKERNVPFYARHGFRVTGEVDAPKGGPRLWLMWRDPLDPGA